MVAVCQSPGAVWVIESLHWNRLKQEICREGLHWAAVGVAVEWVARETLEDEEVMVRGAWHLHTGTGCIP